MLDCDQQHKSFTELYRTATSEKNWWSFVTQQKAQPRPALTQKKIKLYRSQKPMCGTVSTIQSAASHVVSSLRGSCLPRKPASCNVPRKFGTTSVEVQYTKRTNLWNHTPENIIGVRVDITCASKISTHYFGSKRAFPMVCYKCGNGLLQVWRWFVTSVLAPILSWYHLKSQGQAPVRTLNLWQMRAPRRSRGIKKMKWNGPGLVCDRPMTAKEKDVLYSRWTCLTSWRLMIQPFDSSTNSLMHCMRENGVAAWMYCMVLFVGPLVTGIIRETLTLKINVLVVSLS